MTTDQVRMGWGGGSSGGRVCGSDSMGFQIPPGSGLVRLDLSPRSICHMLLELYAIVTVFLSEAQALHGRNQMISLCFPKQEKEDSDRVQRKSVLLPPSGGQMTLGVK